ncbi:MAG: hypothetical protein GYA21_16895 [Myxococcales bacterium]|nr:hypothetical protein [Myxococcales bacterium]
MTEFAEDPKLRRIERHYLKVFHYLEPASLRTHVSREPEWPDAGALGSASVKSDRPQDTFLDFYGREGLAAALEVYGLFDEVRRRGLGEPSLSFSRFEDTYDVLRIHGSASPHPLVELIAKTGPLPPEVREPPGLGACNFLHVKWLRMQNPLAPPSPDKPLLPGQAFPGLGMGREVLSLLQMMAHRLDLDGVVEVPERLHNAALYFVRFRFLNPEEQGVFTSILRDTREHTLADLAWGVECGALLDLNSHKPFRWLPREQVLPRRGPVLEWLESAEYRDRARQAMERSRFQLSTGDITLDEVRAATGGSAENPFPVKIK